MNIVRTFLIFVFGSMLAGMVSGIIAVVVHLVTPVPGLEFWVGGILWLGGSGLALLGAVRAAKRRDRYDTCPACAFDVRQVNASPDGSLRCPHCGQWLNQ